MENESRKLFIILIICVIFSIITLIIDVSDNKNEQSNYGSSTSSTNKEKIENDSFYKSSLMYIKYSLNAYMDRQEKSTTGFTISDLSENYSYDKSTDFRGCVIVTVDTGGNIIDRIIYITNGKKMIINKKAEEISDKDINKYSKKTWDSNYDTCNINGVIVSTPKTTDTTY